jgi:hypothetical protein
LLLRLEASRLLSAATLDGLDLPASQE